MNPDEHGQYILDIDSYYNEDSNSIKYMTSESGIDFANEPFLKARLSDLAEDNTELDQVNYRLQRIERALGIPADLDRNVEMEEKHPHLKQLADEYALAVEQHITLELLTPPDLEEDDYIQVPF